MEQLASLNCVPSAVRDRPRYVGDHVIRHYRPLGLAALLRDLDADPETTELTIIGGIGTLTMRADGSEDWKPTVRSSAIQTPAPRQVDPALSVARRSACAACDSFRDLRCTAAGCGCAGEGKPDLWSSRCPLDKWPPLTPIDCNP